MRFLPKLFVIYLASAVGFGVLEARADTMPAKCHVTQVNNALLLSPDMPGSYFDANETIRKVKDGLALTVERRVVALNSQKQPVAQSFARCRLIYDLWAETFILTDNAGTATTDIRYKSNQHKDALERCAQVTLTTDNFASLKVNVVVNPIDAKTEERTRNWLAAKGLGGTGSGVVGRAIGAVLNLKADSAVDYECNP